MKLVKCNAVLFISYSAYKISDFFDQYQEKYSGMMQRVCKMNGKSFNSETDPIMEFECYTEKNISSSNLMGEGIMIYPNSGGNYHMVCDKYIPASLFKGCVEGDRIIIRLPMTFTTIRDGVKTSERGIVELNAILDQNWGYNERIRFKGSYRFEEVMNAVIEECNRWY